MESVEQKQQYLCQHIIDSGYDADEFTQYCQRMMGGIDIEGWSLADLEHIVKGFVGEKKGARAVQTTAQHPNTKPLESRQVTHLDTNSSEWPLTPSTTTATFRLEDLDSLFSMTFTARTDHSQKPPQPAAGGFNTVGSSKPIESSLSAANGRQQPAVSAPKYSFDDMFKIPGAATANTKSQQNINTEKQIGNLNIFDTEHDEPQSSSAQLPVRTMLNSKVEEAVLKKPKNHSESPTRKDTTKPKFVLREPKKEMLKCAKAPERQLLNRQLEVEVRGHEIVNRNFFVPDYVLYHVYTRGINTEVKRKYDHFQRLRAILAKLYPNCRLPYLEKKTWLSETDIDFIKKQKGMLQSFLNDLLMNRELKNSKVLEDFLTITEHTKIKAALTEYEALPKLKSLEELSLLQGQVELDHSERSKDYMQRVTPYLTGFSEGLGRFLRLSEQLSLNYGALLKTITEVGELLAGMAQSTQQLHEQLQQAEVAATQQQIQGLRGALLTTGRFYEELANNAKFELRLVESHLRPLLRFEKENVLTMSELVQTRERMSDQLTRQEEQKDPPKEVSSSRVIDAPKTAIDQPNRSNPILRQQTAFYNQACLTESCRLLADLAVKIRSRYRQLANLYRERWTAHLPLLQEVGSL